MSLAIHSVVMTEVEWYQIISFYTLYNTTEVTILWGFFTPKHIITFWWLVCLFTKLIRKDWFNIWNYKQSDSEFVDYKRGSLNWAGPRPRGFFFKEIEDCFSEILSLCSEVPEEDSKECPVVQKHTKGGKNASLKNYNFFGQVVVAPAVEQWHSIRVS